MTNANQPYSQPKSDGPTLSELSAMLWVRKWTVIGLTVLIAACCTAYAFIATPIYHAATVVSPVPVDRSMGGGAAGALGQLGGLASLAGVSLDPKDAATEEALAVMRSREFLEAFIADHNLLPQFFASKWDSVAKKWTVPEKRQPTPAKGAKYFNEKVMKVLRDKKTGLVTISIDWRDRSQAAAWANEIVARVNAEMRKRAQQNAEAYTQYLEHALESSQLMETRSAISRIIEGQVKQQMLAAVTVEYAFRTVDRALPADADDILSPKKALWIIGGAVGGFIAASLLVLTFAGDPRRRSESR